MATWDKTDDTKGDGWSAGAASYEKYVYPMTESACRQMVRVLDAMRPIDSDSNVLDCGTGGGTVTRVLRDLYPALPITASDISEGMMENLDKQKLPGVKLVVTDATDMDRELVPEAAFSHVLAAHMIQFCGAKQPDVIREIFDTLRPGGIAAVSLSARHTVADPWNKACKRLDPSYETIESHDDLAWKTAEEAAEGMKAAGFEDVRVEKYWMDFVTLKTNDDYIDFWFRGKHPVFTNREMKQWKGDPDDVIPMVRTVLEEEYKDLSHEIGSFSDIAIGRKPA